MKKQQSETSRRSLLAGGALAAGAAGALGFAGVGAAWTAGRQEPASGESVHDSYPLFGEHQPGIETPAQDRLHFVALTVKVKTKQELRGLFEDWTVAAERLMAGQEVGQERSYQSPPDDTGEAMDLSASHLTLTFGLGRSLFVNQDGTDRFGLKEQLPAALTEIPKMSGDALEEARSGGDLCIQACADDPQVAVHAVRNLIRIAGGRAVVAWSQLGFGRTSSTSTSQVTPRNLFGFKDGTSNVKAEDPGVLAQHVWTSADNSEGSPAWMEGGSYCAVRRIRMNIEMWDRASLKEQEQVVGRTKKEGAPLSGGSEFTAPDFSMQGKYGPIIPSSSHVHLMHPEQNQGVQMLRRGYNYTDGTDGLGHLDAGLFFIAYICDPRTHFVPVLQKMMKSDAMSEYLRHTGSALFAVPPGVSGEDDFVASGLFD
ncbi:MAG: iron uptake transporter deferrochelatase/peroxidase subunit [Rothia sp. (in: high G+C Gram-positive bacteria)]|nr:iron uptake transporter deferrochelatase/peroxidase subunit [Rothia sp. (in: high G+C Gram-positive bacteria)]